MGTIPGARGMGTIPGARGMGTIPGARGMGTIPGARGMGIVPGARGMGIVPGARGMGTIPGARGMGTVAGARGMGTIPGARGMGTVAGCDTLLCCVDDPCDCLANEFWKLQFGTDGDFCRCDFAVTIWVIDDAAANLCECKLAICWAVVAPCVKRHQNGVERSFAAPDDATFCFVCFADRVLKATALPVSAKALVCRKLYRLRGFFRLHFGMHGSSLGGSLCHDVCLLNFSGYWWVTSGLSKRDTAAKSIPPQRRSRQRMLRSGLG
jgi:hypothetical protein